MAADDAEKTEDATPKKKEDARKKGQVAQSRDVSTVMLLVAGTLALASPLGVHLAGIVYELSREVWSGMLIRPDSVEDYHVLMMRVGLVVGLGLAPFALIFMVVGMASNLAQIGWMVSLEAMQPKFEKLNPISGLKRMISLDKLYELAKSMLKLILVVSILIWLLSPALPGVLMHIGASTAAIGALAGDLLKDSTWTILFVFAIFAVADYAWQRYQYEKRLRMTKQEVRDETKQREGDPKVKSRIRQIQREVAQQRMFDAVADADVVVVNPTHFVDRSRRGRSDSRLHSSLRAFDGHRRRRHVRPVCGRATSAAVVDQDAAAKQRGLGLGRRRRAAAQTQGQRRLPGTNGA